MPELSMGCSALAIAFFLFVIFLIILRMDSIRGSTAYHGSLNDSDEQDDDNDEDEAEDVEEDE